MALLNDQDNGIHAQKEQKAERRDKDQLPHQSTTSPLGAHLADMPGRYAPMDLSAHYNLGTPCLPLDQRYIIASGRSNTSAADKQ